MRSDRWRRAEKVESWLYGTTLVLIAVAVVLFVLALLISVAFGVSHVALAEIAIVTALLSGVSYMLARCIPVNIPSEEIARRARVKRDAELPKELEEYQSVDSGSMPILESAEEWARRRAWAKRWEREADNRLALAKSMRTREERLEILARDEVPEVRHAAQEMLNSAEFRAEQARRRRAREKSEIEMARVRQQGERIERHLEIKRREAEIRREKEAERLLMEPHTAEWRRLAAAQSTDTSQHVLRFLAMNDGSAEVRRAAVETLALLRQAGF